MTRDLLSWLGGLALVAALLVGGYFTARGHGVEAERARALAAENERLTAISLAVGETVARANALAGDVERLRRRPERVREVIKEVRVESDDRCADLPPEWVRRWNAGADDPADAGAAGVDDGARMPVAAAAR